MELLQLAFECGDDSLSVRRFAVREGMSSLFEVSVWARSPNDDLDLGAFVGRPAAFRIARGVSLAGARGWSGVCSFMEQEEAEPTGLSSYHLRLAPSLWLLGHRRNHSIFQHRSVPEIVGALLAEWGIEPVWRLRREAYPRLEYRVQYGESDLAFTERLLEEAGISFFFSDAGEKGSALVLTDAPEAADARAGGAVPYADHPDPALEQELVTKVKVAQEVRHGKVTLRDFDFRRRLDFPLFGRASAPASAEERLEHYGYEPGAFVVEGGAGGDTPAADDKAVARAEEKEGAARAARQLAGERAERQSVAFETNVLDLAPGVVLSIGRHPRSDLAADKRLLVTELSLDGTHEGKRMASGRAVFAHVPHRPRKKTPKPRIHGVQSAVVVGPPGEEIHTDEFGRVRVQFHWDREGERDDESSCWMRVSQGWAGGGYGMMALPRVGHEVVVGFFEGDPDQPVVVGRVFNNTARVPYKLPEHRTRSTWKSESSPGSGGFNELMFEDGKGRELVYVQAERNLEALVKVDETLTVGRDRDKRVGANETIDVGVDRTARIGAVDASVVGVRHSVTIQPTGGAGLAPTGGAEHTRTGGAGHTRTGGAGHTRTGGAGLGPTGGAEHTRTGGAGLGPTGGAGHTRTGGAGLASAWDAGLAPTGDLPIAPTGSEMVDRRITLTTGEATITLEGPNITLDAAAGILMKAGTEIALGAGSHVTVDAAINMTLKSGAKLVVRTDDGDVVIQGGPIVRINPEDRRWRRAGEAHYELPVEVPQDVDLAAELDEAEEHAWFDPEEPNWLHERMRSGDWDFGSRGAQYKDFESFHMGAVGAALGLSEGVVLRQAGMRRRDLGGEVPVGHGDPGNGLWGGREPYGLDPHEHAMIKKGFAFYGERYMGAEGA